MSFDLFVWYESEPITADQAHARLERDVFVASPAVGQFCDALLGFFPPLESLAENDIQGRFWSVTPVRSDELIVLAVIWARADEVWAAVQDLATEYGLVCYEPGDHVLNPNAPGYTPAFTLSSETVPPIPDPDDHRVSWLMGLIGADDRFALLERSDGWFAQVGYGEISGAPEGTYVLEYQEGGLDRHFSTRTTDIAEAKRFLQEFLAGDETWKRRHVWRLIQL